MVRFSVVYQEPEDPTAFDRHYRKMHIPLARKLPGLRRYTISRDVAPIRGVILTTTLYRSSTGTTCRPSSGRFRRRKGVRRRMMWRTSRPRARSEAWFTNSRSAPVAGRRE
jgi:hypothetical protein